MKRFAAAVCLALLMSAAAVARDYFVAPSGDDTHPGTKDQPFRSLRKAAGALAAGDTCFVRGGTYRETVRFQTSGANDKPIRFIAWPGERVILSGAEKITGSWTPYRGAIWKTPVDRLFIQLFADGRMMFEARWPNVTLDRVFARETWANAGKGSRYGKMVDPQLARTGIDWTGAVATLNVAHQFFTWSRTVREHSKGSDTFTYEKNLEGITHYADKTTPWEDDRYYLTGKLEALDSPGEWYLDRKNLTLYFWPPAGKKPGGLDLQAKVRPYAFDATRCDYVEVRGFHFFATTFRFDRCDHCTVDGCHLLFPSYARRLEDPEAPDELGAETLMEGDHNTVRNCSLAYCPGGGLLTKGRCNTVENCVIHDTCWFGSLRDMPLLQTSTAEENENAPCVTRFNTVFSGGNALIGFRGWGGHLIEYNHAYRGGLSCKDVALIYTGSPATAGSVVRYNWAHGCRTEEKSRSGLSGGLGIRGDDQTRSLTVHHNVVWDCGRDGIIVKGDHNVVCNNTVFDIGTEKVPGNYINLHTEPEPKKWWRNQFPLLPVQNAHSSVFNNAALTVTGGVNGQPLPAGKNVSHNYQEKNLGLVNPAGMDFRPRQDSPLVDAGREATGVTDGYRGKAPDAGAYEFGAERWIPGHRNAVWLFYDGEGLRAALSMPAPEPVEVAIGTGTLTFTPDNWMTPQAVPLASDARDVQVAIAKLRFQQSVPLKSIDPLWGLQCPFAPIP